MKIRIFAGVLFLLGASILLYPSVSAYLNSQNQAKVVEDYSNQVKQMNDAETEKELQKAREFNENLKRTVVIDPFTEEMNQQLSEEYLKILNKNNGQIGTLIIPKIQLKLPVYHGTEAKVLKKGVGHIQNTAFPVGGGGTHAVLSAHRGLPEARLFTDLDKLEKGDIVAVEAAPGHDIGVVTLTGRLVPLQMKKANFKADTEIKRVYRKAKPVDMEKFNEAKAKEHATMIRARQIALNLNLDMKIGDVEYQGDGNKAIFYYIADERVDFRQLIKVLAEAFRVRIEMKQIGARQEAGRIGGIGPCGRELCCATWMTSFVSVSTSAARFQDISLNPQKLAGQCAKLKCCLNYEVDCYVEAQKRLPSREIELETKDGTFYFFKADILSNQVSYSTDKNFPANLVTISGKRAFEVISMNKKGMKPDSLIEEEKKPEPKKPVDLLEQESVTRFDRSRNNKDGGNNANRNNKKKKKGNNNNNNGNRPQQQTEGGNRPQQPQRENENRPQPSENGNRGERDNRPRNNNNNRNRGQNQGRNNENRRPERGQNQERPQGQERPSQERPQGQERQERRPNLERPSKPERNQNQEKLPNNEKSTQE